MPREPTKQYYAYDIWLNDANETRFKGICKLTKKEYKQRIKDFAGVENYYNGSKDVDCYFSVNSYTLKKLKEKPSDELLKVLYEDLDDILIPYKDTEDEDNCEESSNDDEIIINKKKKDLKLK